MVEIMSPAGNFETLAAAIQAGAGSVYFGLGNLNMRAKSAVNFQISDLDKIVSICNQSNVKTYLALNTIMYDGDLQEMRQMIDLAAQKKVSAIIASDAAVLEYALKQGVEIHASTQLNISNIEAVKFYSRFCDVMVLARELNLEQVKNIHRQIVEQDIRGPKGELVKIEMFIHGALCMAVSGKCYLSLHEANRGANRGACIQICRRGYSVIDNETGAELNIENQYIMSPKDLCTVGFIDKLVDAGVEVMKIEGRARPPEYVKTVTQVYHEAVKAVENKSYSAENIAVWKDRLRTVFNRDFWNGYYLGQRLGEWNNSYGSRAKYHKEFVGSINNFFPKLSVAEVYVNSGRLVKGDKIYIIGPTTGCIETQVTEIRIDDKQSQCAVKGQVVSIPVPEKVRRSDKIYVLVENK